MLLPSARRHPPLPPDGGSEHWLLSTPRLTLAASREGDRLPTTTGPGQFRSLARSAELALGTSPPGTAVVGAVPFDESAPAHLLLTRLLRHTHRPGSRPQTLRALQPECAPGRTPVSAALAAPCAGPPESPVYEPTPRAYRAAVREALAAIDSGTVSKVVLARTLRIPLPDSGSPRQLAAALLTALARREPAAHLFSVSLPCPSACREAPVLVGATPETLLRRTGDLLTLTPLAGTAPRDPDPALDRELATALLRSAKDHAEHRHVTDTLRRLLEPLCRTLDIPAAPRLYATGRLWHLATPIRARLRLPAPSSLALACALHPTPAVCGTPTTRAAALLSALEPLPRRYYSGLVGWMDQKGDGHWVIALRCGEARRGELRLYAGAGIVEGSSPDAESAETEAKLATMRDALDDTRAAMPPHLTPTGAPR
ncbi:isochorismate synthase MenF [Streptomyces sp. NPDC058657]|uniref:isochorismate synthase n=1 Tax=unclassified Streptomyces TaxID=2593676 RepID=UPI00365CA9B9